MPQPVHPHSPPAPVAAPTTAAPGGVPDRAAAEPAGPTVAAAGRSPVREGLVLVVALLAAAKLLAHLLTTGAFGYGFFVDELYYLALSRHLAPGFVDMPPLFPLLTAGVRALLGDSLFAVRLLPTVAGAGLVAMTGLLARELGGGRVAAGLAGLSVLVAPIYLLMSSFHTMNALDPLFWTGAAWLLLKLAEGGGLRVAVALGLVAGLALLNKHAFAFWGIALVAGLLVTRARALLLRRETWLALAVAILVFLPNLAWNVKHGFPHLAHLAQVRADGRDVALSPLKFLAEQVLALHPLALLVWAGGLAFLLFHPSVRRARFAGVAFLVLIGLMIALDGRAYYPAPAYPFLLAAGGVAIERFASTAARRALVGAYAAALFLTGAALAPLTLPCLPPELFVRYTEATGLAQPRIENHRLGPLPQLHADRFGWEEMAREVARVYHALPPADRAKAAVFGQNYGQAGAIDLYGPALGLPPALSGHLAYHDWGPRGFTGEVVVVLDDDRETLERHFESVEHAGRVSHPWSMPYQHFDVWVCRGMRYPLAEVWPKLKKLG